MENISKLPRLKPVASRCDTTDILMRRPSSKDLSSSLLIKVLLRCISLIVLKAMEDIINTTLARLGGRK